MPGRVYLTSDQTAIAEHMGAIVQGEITMPRLDLAPGEEMHVMTPDRVLQPMRWGMIMSGRTNARRRPVMETIVNARSETVFQKSAFKGVSRGLVPVNGWYGWTGKPRRKIRWRIRRADEGLLVFAAIFDVWTAPGGIEVPQVATITCEPNDLIRPIHHRMGAILEPDDWEPWLAGKTVPLKPAPDNVFTIEEVEEPVG